jgi:beta-lactamase superfamily II metal-dependent hydrolase
MIAWSAARLTPLPTPSPAGTLRVSVLDVGQGDSILIQSVQLLLLLNRIESACFVSLRISME